MQTLDRRSVLQLTAATGTALMASPARGDTETFQIVDTNVHLGHWPFRRLPLDDAHKLNEKLALLGVSQAWACSFEALFHRDLRSVNGRVAKACRDHPRFLPIGAINPRLPDWEEDLRICAERHRMPGVRVYPNYHNYTLSSPEFRALLANSAKFGLLIQVAVAMEDVRTQHPSARVPDVDLASLASVVSKSPTARVQLLNFRPRTGDINLLTKLPNLYVDTARVESTDGVPTLAKAAPKQTLFGSHAPLLIPEAAVIRVHESNQLEAPQLRAVYQSNAKSLLAVLSGGSKQ